MGGPAQTRHRAGGARNALGDVPISLIGGSKWIRVRPQSAFVFVALTVDNAGTLGGAYTDTNVYISSFALTPQPKEQEFFGSFFQKRTFFLTSF
jgi:hypothetical protein